MSHIVVSDCCANWHPGGRASDSGKRARPGTRHPAGGTKGVCGRPHRIE